MKLSVELFQRTVDRLHGENVLNDRPDRRDAQRVELHCRVHLHLVELKGWGPPVEAWTRDISRSGLGVIMSRKMKFGDCFLLGLPHESPAEAQKSLALYCTVRSCHELVTSIHSVGFSFEDLRAKQVAPAAVTTLQPGDEDRIRKAILG